MSEPEWTDADFEQYDEDRQEEEYEAMLRKEESDDPLTMALIATRDD